MTAFGVLWVAVGFAYVLLVRELSTAWRSPSCSSAAHGRATPSPTSWAGPSAATMAPRISPKKSVEGAIGGHGGRGDRRPHGAGSTRPGCRWRSRLLGLVVGLVGQWGDLFESAVKRDFRVKDSGKILPGHGGILDRFDSVLFAGFAAYWLAIAAAGRRGAMKRVIVLGRPGPIGVQALQVIAASSDLCVVGLSCDRNVSLLLEQATSLGVTDVAIADEAAAGDRPAALYPELDVRVGPGARRGWSARSRPTWC